jgi:hypothetical protein
MKCRDDSGLYSTASVPVLCRKMAIFTGQPAPPVSSNRLRPAMIKVKIELNFFIFSRNLKGETAHDRRKNINQEIRVKLSQTLLDFPVVPQKGHIINLLDFVDEVDFSAEARDYIFEVAESQAEDNLFYREITAVIICNGYLLVTC